ncbi:MAG: HK97 gp10 family phage protein [Fimbriimonadia bacterium]|nr:HK97 gp10 family phage protein [Fimbriimonadia bacterium]
MGQDTLRLLSQVVRKTAFDIEAEAKKRVPVDTGALKNSIHTVTDTTSGWSAARATNPPDNPFFGEIRPRQPLEAIVAVGQHYGAPVEYGSAGRPAKPYLAPATEQMRPVFDLAVREGLRRASRP